MAQTLSRLQILLHADTANFRREMRGARDEIGGFGGFAQKAMGAFATTVAAGASAAAVAVGGIVKQQLSAASEIQKFSQLANTTTDQFQRMAAGAQSYGIGSEQLASTLKDVNDKVGDFLTTGGGEMADFFEKIAPKVGVTAEQFRGLSGADALQLYYSSLEKANLSQAEMVFYLESIADDATSLQPLLANGGAEMKKYGDAAQQAGAIMSKDTIAGAQQVNAAVGVLKTQFAGLSVQVFTEMLPSLQQLSTWITNNRDGIQQFATAVGQGLSAIGGGIGTAVSVIGTFASKVSDAFNTVSNFVNDNKEAFIALGTAIATAAVAFGAMQAGIAIFGVFASGAATVAALSGALTAITTVIGGVGAAIAIIASPITIAVVAIAALTAAGVYLYRNWDEVKAKALVVWDAIGGTVAGVVDSVSQKYQSMVGAVSNAMSSVASSVSSGWATVKGIFATQIAAVKAVVSAGVSVFSTIFGTQFAIIKTVVTTAFNVIKSVVNGDMQGVKNAIGNGFNQAVSIIKGAVSNIVNAVRNLGSQLFNAGTEAVQGLVNGIKSKVSSVKDAAMSLASTVKENIKSPLRIFSPSRVTTELGEHAGQGLANGLKNKATVVGNNAAQLANQVIDSINAIKREVAIMQDGSALAELNYDIANGKYNGVSPQLLDQLKLVTQLKAEYTATKAELDKFKQAQDSVNQSIADLNKQIALYGNDGGLASLQYDIVNTQKYAGVSADSLQSLIDKTQQLEQLKKQQQATQAFESLNQDMTVESPIQKLEREYQGKVAVITNYETAIGKITAESAMARAKVEEEYIKRKKDIVAGGYQNVFDTATSALSLFSKKQKEAYQGMLVASKIFAMRQSLIDSWSAISKAWASLPFPANLGAVALATAQTGIIPKIIGAISTTGFMTGGFTGYGRDTDVAGLVHANEWVSTAGTTRKYRPELEAMHNGTYDKLKTNNTSVNIVFENHTSATISQAPSKDGEMRFVIRDEIDKYVPQQLSQTNTPISRALLQNTTATRRV